MPLIRLDGIRDGKALRNVRSTSALFVAHLEKKRIRRILKTALELSCQRATRKTYRSNDKGACRCIVRFRKLQQDNFSKDTTLSAIFMIQNSFLRIVKLMTEESNPQRSRTLCSAGVLASLNPDHDLFYHLRIGLQGLLADGDME